MHRKMPNHLSRWGRAVRFVDQIMLLSISFLILPIVSNSPVVAKGVGTNCVGSRATVQQLLAHYCSSENVEKLLSNSEFNFDDLPTVYQDGGGSPIKLFRSKELYMTLSRAAQDSNKVPTERYIPFDIGFNLAGGEARLAPLCLVASDLTKLQATFRLKRVVDAVIASRVATAPNQEVFSRSVETQELFFAFAQKQLVLIHAACR